MSGELVGVIVEVRTKTGGLAGTVVTDGGVSGTTMVAGLPTE